MKSSAKNIKLTSVDDLFATEETRADDLREKVQEIPLEQLHPFKDHPFQVRDDIGCLSFNVEYLCLRDWCRDAAGVSGRRVYGSRAEVGASRNDSLPGRVMSCYSIHRRNFDIGYELGKKRFKEYLENHFKRSSRNYDVLLWLV